MAQLILPISLLQGSPAIVGKIRKLASEPRPAGAEKLSGQEKYRLRQGNYRVLHSADDTELTVVVVKIGHRRDACLSLISREPDCDVLKSEPGRKAEAAPA